MASSTSLKAGRPFPTRLEGRHEKIEDVHVDASGFSGLVDEQVCIHEHETLVECTTARQDITHNRHRFQAGSRLQEEPDYVHVTANGRVVQYGRITRVDIHSLLNQRSYSIEITSRGRRL